jgi:hypothetical protein
MGTAAERRHGTHLENIEIQARRSFKEWELAMRWDKAPREAPRPPPRALLGPRGGLPAG